MKIEAKEAECYRCHHHILDTGGCLFTAIEQSTGAMGGADEVQSNRQSEEKREGIAEAGTYRDVPEWKHGVRKISTPCLQRITLHK